MKIWIVWEDEYDWQAPASIHTTEAGARAAAAKLALDDWERGKAAHDAAEMRRIDDMGSWVYVGPFGPGTTFAVGVLIGQDGSRTKGEWHPVDPRPDPEPFPKTVSAYERRVEEYELTTD